MADQQTIDKAIEKIEMLIANEQTDSDEYLRLVEMVREAGVTAYKKGGMVKKKVKKVGAQPKTVKNKKTKNVMRGTGAAIRGTKFKGVF